MRLVAVSSPQTGSSPAGGSAAFLAGRAGSRRTAAAPPTAGFKEFKMEQKLKIAVFIEFDNIEIGVKATLHREFDVATVLDSLKERGAIVPKCAYAKCGRQESATADP